MLLTTTTLTMLCSFAGLLTNADFGEGLAHWTPNDERAGVRYATGDEPGTATIAVAPEAAIGFPYLYQELPAHHGQYFRLRVEARGEGVRGGQ